MAEWTVHFNERAVVVDLPDVETPHQLTSAIASRQAFGVPFITELDGKLINVDQICYAEKVLPRSDVG